MLDVQENYGTLTITKGVITEKWREVPIKLLEHIIGNNKEQLRFRLFFLGKEDLDVKVIVVNKINFDDLKKQLKNGKSVFMTTLPKRN